jgi:hypothetical protein
MLSRGSAMHRTTCRCQNESALSNIAAPTEALRNQQRVFAPPQTQESKLRDHAAQHQRAKAAPSGPPGSDSAEIDQTGAWRWAGLDICRPLPSSAARRAASPSVDVMSEYVCGERCVSDSSCVSVFIQFLRWFRAAKLADALRDDARRVAELWSGAMALRGQLKMEARRPGVNWIMLRTVSWQIHESPYARRCTGGNPLSFARRQSHDGRLCRLQGPWKRVRSAPFQIIDQSCHGLRRMQLLEQPE